MALCIDHLCHFLSMGEDSDLSSLCCTRRRFCVQTGGMREGSKVAEGQYAQIAFGKINFDQMVKVRDTKSSGTLLMANFECESNRVSRVAQMKDGAIAILSVVGSKTGTEGEQQVCEGVGQPEGAYVSAIIPKP